MRKHRVLYGVALGIMMFASFSTQAANQTLGENNMNRTEICKRNFRTLFNGEALTNTGTDPEMMQILQKYIFGEVFTIGELDMKTREMLTVISLSTQQTLPQLKAHAQAALNVGVTPLELREAVYQCAPFIGFPKTLNALNTINEVFTENGIKLPLENQNQVTEENRHEKGLALQQPLYGTEIKDMLEGLPTNMGDEAARLLTEVYFGDFCTRGVLDMKTRELLTIGILVTSGNWDTLSSHIKGSLKAGNKPEEVAAAIIQCMPYIGFPNGLKALKILKSELE